MKMMPLSFGNIILLKEKGEMRESVPRQVDKKSRGPRGERGLGFSRRRKGQFFFPLYISQSQSHKTFFSLSPELMITQQTTQFKLCAREYPGGSEVKGSGCNTRDLGLIPGSGRSPGEGNGNPLQYSCLENPMDGGAWCPRSHKESDMTERLHFHFQRLYNNSVYA